MAMKRVC